MSERDPTAGHSARLLRGLVWAGVLLAPLAAAIVLLGRGAGSVRFAVLLIAVSVVLLGASVLIRSDPVLQRMHVEDRLAEEAEALRAEFARAGATPRSRPGESSFFGDEPMPPASGYAPAGRAGAAAAPPMPGPRREPGTSSGGRVMAGTASASASVPRRRGAASVRMPPGSLAGPPRASAAVRPAVQYGRPDSLDGDFGASDGYDISHAMPPPGVYGGSARVRVSDYASGYDAPDDGYGPSGNTYGRPRAEDDDHGYGRPVEDDSAGYGLAGGYDGPGRSTGDPHYRAKRHRPSANDTNVGGYEDFGGYGGWSGQPEPDERYVHRYGRGRR